MKKIKLYIMSCITALAIKFLHKYLLAFYMEHIQDTNTAEIITYLGKRLDDGDPIYIALNPELAKNALELNFEEDLYAEDELPYTLEEEDEDKKVH